MPPWLDDLMHRYGWIWVGLTFGLGAKYALLIKRGVRVRAKLVLADVLLLPMVALIAYWFVGIAGVHGEAAALFASLSTVGADRLVKLLTDRFVSRVDSEAGVLASQMMGRARATVANELVADRLIDDAITGRAPESYKALERRSAKPKKD